MSAKSPFIPVFRELEASERVRGLLSQAVRDGRVAHAYLFVGAPGSGTAECAWALASAIVCPNGGCGACDECIRVKHHTHPDVHFFAPASAQGYLVGQVRELIDDVALAPIRSARKVYLVTQADRLTAASANALLKTLEEPPASCVFILEARTADSVLPTIRSRCQVVPFELPAPQAAAEAVARAAGVDVASARVALAVAQGQQAAEEFLASPARRAVRDQVVRAVSQLPRMDEWEVLVAARELTEAVKAPLADVKSAQEALAERDADFLTPAAMKDLEARNKRELTARERSGMMEALQAANSLLRDVLVRCEGLGAEELVNTDRADVVGRLALATSTTGVLRALGAVTAAADDLSHNVSPQLALEVMLLNVKEALACLS